MTELLKIKTGSPESVGILSNRLERVYQIIDQAVESKAVLGASVLIARRGMALEPRSFGRMSFFEKAPPCSEDTIFLIASVTKPVTAAGTMLLVERGKLCLDDRVSDIVPEFSKNGKAEVKIRHLLTHTSGLPDMLPENQELRQNHAPLKEFIKRICESELAFPPGTRAQYQSCGIAMLAEIVERIEGLPFREFLKREIFEPLGMVDSSLGVREGMEERIALVNISEEQHKTDWNWNTPYWWNFGAPWGGMFSTVKDLWRFCQMFLNKGKLGETQIFSPATVTAMTTNRLLAMPDLPARVKLTEAWGLGWRLQIPNSAHAFGDLASPATYGHMGATGTIVWVDPKLELILVLLTNQPGGMGGKLFWLCSNAVVGAIIS